MTANLIKAKGAAFRLHQEFKIKKPADIRLKISQWLRMSLVLEAELDGAEARLIREGSMGLVRINSKIPEPGRKRFAASHELGHWQIHERGVYICTAADMADYQKSPREVEANAFAAEFLMPSFLFRPLCANKSPSLELVEELKIRFNTTLTATTFRMMDEISADCMMLLTKNRKVERWRKSPNCALPLFVETGSSLSPQSVAYHCNQTR